MVEPYQYLESYFYLVKQIFGFLRGGSTLPFVCLSDIMKISDATTRKVLIDSSNLVLTDMKIKQTLDRHVYTHTDRHANKLTDKQTDLYTDRLTDR